MKIVEIHPGTFVYRDPDNEGRHICPVCYENRDKEITLREHPAQQPRPGVVIFAHPKRLACPVCKFWVEIS